MQYTQAGLGRRRGVWAASIGLAVVALLAACAGSGSTSRPLLAQATDTATTAATSAATATNTAQATNTPRPTPTNTPRPRATPTPTPRPRPTPTPTPSMVVVKITGANGNWAFMPQTVTIKVGTTVEWMNVSDAPHTSTSDTGVWDSMNIPAMTGTYEFTFAAAGTYNYHCSYHNFMTGTITVTS